MEYAKLDKKKGVAGLNVYLSLIAMLFMIGIIVMVFQIAGSKLADSSRDVTSVSVVNESGGWINSTGYTLDGASNLNARSFSVTAYNVSSGTAVLIPASNYSVSSVGLVANATALTYPSVNFTYTYVYDAENDASTSINETKGALAESTGFFGTFVVLGAMVVLILLVVIIINSIRASGITEGA